MYADDTHLTFASNNILNINTVLNEDLARVEKWLIANKLTLNASKTEVMLIGSRHHHHHHIYHILFGKADVDLL